MYLNKTNISWGKRSVKWTPKSTPPTPERDMDSSEDEEDDDDSVEAMQPPAKRQKNAAATMDPTSAASMSAGKQCQHCLKQHWAVVCENCKLRTDFDSDKAIRMFEHMNKGLKASLSSSSSGTDSSNTAQNKRDKEMIRITTHGEPFPLFLDKSQCSDAELIQMGVGAYNYSAYEPPG